MWEPAVSGTGNVHDCTPKLQAYPPIFSLTPKASGSTRLQSCEDRVVDSRLLCMSKFVNSVLGYIIDYINRKRMPQLSIYLTLRT